MERKTFKGVWLPIDIPPVEEGSYLVTTCKGKIRIDRYDGESWGLCRPRNEIRNRDKGRYKPHKAWSIMPEPYEERTDE